MSQIFYLHAAGGTATQALTLGQGLPKEVNGLPAFYYWRQAVADGSYVHPKHGWKLDVNKSRRETWEANFRAMASAGIGVPIVEDHQERAGATLGYVVGVRQNGPWLEELHQYLGEQQRDVALRNKVSIGLNPEYVDGQGRFVGEALVHSAITPVPVCDGQGDAVRVAASRGPATALTFELAAVGSDAMAEENTAGTTTEAGGEQSTEGTQTTEQTEQTTTTESGLSAVVEKCKTASQGAIDASREIVDMLNANASAELSAEAKQSLGEAIQYLQTAVDAAYSAISAARTKIETQEEKAETIVMSRAAWNQATAQHDRAKADLSKANARVAELSKAAGPAPAANVLKLMARTIEGQAEMAIASGGVSPDVAGKLKGLLIGSENNLNRFTLSMADGEEKPIAWSVFEILRDNKPVQMGSRTGVQTLSRAVPGEEGKPGESATADNPLLAVAEQMYKKPH